MKAYTLSDEDGTCWIVVLEDKELARDVSVDYDLPNIEEIELGEEVFN